MSEFVTIVADDGEKLHGAIFQPERTLGSRTAIALFPGGGAEFYDPLLRALAVGLSAAGFPVLLLNRRDHGSNFGFVTIERGALDQAAGIDFLQSAGAARVVLGGHSYASVTVPWYVARFQDTRVPGVLLYSALGDMGMAAVKLCGGPSTYAEYVRRSREAVVEGRAEEVFVLPGMVQGAHPMLTSHAVFLDKRGPESQGDPIRLLGELGDRPILAFRHVRDPFPGVMSQDEPRLREASPHLTLVMVGESGQPVRAAHSFEGDEPQLVIRTVDWLRDNGFE